MNNFHSLPTEDVFKLLKTQSSGLLTEEVELRLKKYGPNKLPDEKKLPLFVLFLRQFKNPLIYILFSAFVISFFTDHYVDAGIILVVILISSVVGFFQEYKANNALEQLKKLVHYKAKVRREGKEVIIPQENVVPGDIVLLMPGDKIPGDGRLIKADNFEVVEASLTGESVPSKKEIRAFEKETPLADRENMVYLGTVVAKGKAEAVIVSTGEKTELGIVAKLVKTAEDSETPLQRQIASFGKMLGIFLVVVNIIIFAVGIITGKPLFEMFLTSVAVVVAAVPEGLLPAMTIILAIGMQKLAKHNGLVRKMLAAETLGSVSVICSDKTGTLTKGEMRVVQIITDSTQVSHDGEKFTETVPINEKASHVTALKIGFLSNNAIVENPNDGFEDWNIVSDSTEKALFLIGYSAGFRKEELEKNEPRIAEIPFDSEYKIMATLHDRKDEKSVTYLKGAPERILDYCSDIDTNGTKKTLTQEKIKEIFRQNKKLTSKGLRVIAVAYKDNDNVIASEDFKRGSLEGFVFVGLVGIKDPLRKEAKETIKQCQAAGIRPIIVTGDHKLTTMAIVSELGMKVDEDNVMEGSQLDLLTDEELQNRVRKMVIFARVEPKHKIRIVSALQKNGESVAMTGDGVNDAPALKKADIGVAVGSGTDVAKEVADLILLDDNFSTILKAVKRGRDTFNNIRKVILYLVTDGFTEIVLVGGSVILGLPLPILPVQILWIKLAESAMPAMALAFDEIDEQVMKDPPRNKNEPIVNKQMKKLIVFYALVMDITLFLLFIAFWKKTGSFDLARTITFVGLGLSSFFYIFAVRGLRIPVYKINPFSNKFLLLSIFSGLVLLLVAVYVPFFNSILHTVPLGLKEWLVLLAFASFSLVVYEIGKKFTLAKT
ncbi:HAD-IC family P-type ATPase [Patescibacteria group bacterium]|nr:HAD-IC family P-type ATPase [Patescibacteria group bacterium]